MMSLGGLVQQRGHHLNLRLGLHQNEGRAPHAGRAAVAYMAEATGRDGSQRDGSEMTRRAFPNGLEPAGPDGQTCRSDHYRHGGWRPILALWKVTRRFASPSRRCWWPDS